jgi:hypothetical protein
MRRAFPVPPDKPKLMQKRNAAQPSAWRQFPTLPVYPGAGAWINRCIASCCSYDAEMGSASRQVTILRVLAFEFNGQPEVIERIGISQRVLVGNAISFVQVE